MRRFFIIILTAILTLSAETLFEVKDSSDNVVLDVSTDGLRVMNQGDTLMVISSSDIRANIGVNNKGLSRAFSVTTTQSKGDGSDLMRLTSDSTRFWISDAGSGFGVSSQTALKEKSVATNFLKVSNVNTQMREGSSGERYTDFSPENIFLGLNAGLATLPGATSGKDNVFIGNKSGITNISGYKNIFIGMETGYDNSNANNNIFIGYQAGQDNNASSNIFLGNYAGKYNTSGYLNTYLGHTAGRDQGSGYYNAYFGYGTGYGKSGGNYNTLLGSFAGATNSSGEGNVFIGYSAGYSETGSNKLYIANSDTSTPIIHGDFSYNNLGFGKQASSLYRLDVLHPTSAGNFEANSSSTATRGIYARANNATSSNWGIYASASGTGATNYAGYFSGNIYVSGSVLKSKDQVTVDHPLDPENKILTHSSVASSEMLNVYSGNILLDEKGKATVQMPEWFEAYNAEFRYQLTGIGSSAPGLFISEELEEGRFGIGGGNPGMKVSWMVTAVRNDNYAKANPLQAVSEKKDNEKGYYFTPGAFGKSGDMSIEKMYERERINTESE